MPKGTEAFSNRSCACVVVVGGGWKTLSSVSPCCTEPTELRLLLPAAASLAKVQPAPPHVCTFPQQGTNTLHFVIAAGM